jgi:hypothetical protein
MPTVSKAVPAKAASKEKRPRSKLVLDSFAMPESERKALSEIKRKCLQSGFLIKKSELLRIAVMLLGIQTVDELKTARDELESIKSGRPKRGYWES